MVTIKQFKVDRDILVYAFRYSLPRISYSSSIVIENIKDNIELFNSGDIELFIKEIKEQEILELYGYGMDIDKKIWLDFADYLREELRKRGE